MKKKKAIIIVLVVLVIIAAGILALKIFNKKDAAETSKVAGEELKEEKKVQIVDVKSKSRPYAVMINNNHAAWPQCGVQDAYLVYEIVAEGGITRMLAIYKDAETAKIGSIRSARHYFIDYAEENDAIFVHWGGSPQAYSRISSSSINDIDGIALEGSTFFRDTTLNRDYEHTGFSSMDKLKAYADKQGYTRDTNKDLLLNYSADEIDLSKIENAKKADDIVIKYSDYHKTSYEYDEENKVYKRSMSDIANVDLVTGKQYTVKNIITYQISSTTINDGENKGRQDLNNTGTGNGYYISNGYAVPITWEKASHSAQTIYRYENGEEITVNDGNTFIQIQPVNQTLSITGEEPTTLGNTVDNTL